MKQLTFRCSCCKRIKRLNPRARNLRYCGSKPCQQARKNKWQRNKQQMDSDHKINKEESQRTWRQQNPGYWKRYRKRNPKYCERNRKLQRIRDVRRRLKNISEIKVSDLAKKDSLAPLDMMRYISLIMEVFLCEIHLSAPSPKD